MVKAEFFEQYFPANPTQDQKKAFQEFVRFLNSHQTFAAYILKGYAGTGKTTLISTLVKALPMLKMRTVLLAPTGRAAKVITAYSGKSAFTIHKKIYRKKVAGTPEMDFALAENKHSNTLFVVDEASMISNERVAFSRQSLLEDLIEYVYSGENCRLMLVGDTAQLPPVGLIESPALSLKTLSTLFSLETFGMELREVVRQQSESGILYNATAIRDQLLSTDENPGDARYPQLLVRGFKDVYRMTGERLIEGLEYAYSKYGMDDTLVVCRSNKNANLYNQNIRNRILYREEELTGGDQIMIVRNNYFWIGEDDNQSFIANGDMAKVRRVGNIHEQFGFRFADVSLEFIDSVNNEPLNCRVILDTLYSDSPNLSREDQNKLFESVMADYQHLPTKRDRVQAIKQDPYYNALQIKFSMAVTCHKAQGGQWGAVFVDQGFLTEEMVDTEFMRWLYTACTRATTELFLLNFSDQFFVENQA